MERSFNDILIGWGNALNDNKTVKEAKLKALSILQTIDSPLLQIIDKEMLQPIVAHGF